jgi:uncharacterized protein (TIGR03067 family)
MTQPQTHPTDAVLADFLLGKLPDPDVAEIESHLAECSACQARAASTLACDTLVGLLAAGARSEWGAASARTPVASGETQGWPGSTPTLTGDLEVPAVLAGHPKYQTERLLGVGGMGTVWLAEHAVMNRLVAVKVIRPDLLARPGATGRFLREVRAAAKLHHPNIVTAFDAEPVGDSCLLVMEYVDGETLAERLKAGPLPVTEACRAVCDAARGLAHAHAAGLVHRDVKPHNLIRAADGTTKVLDFGLAGVGAGEMVAVSGDGLSGAGMVCGTPDYIAPEQAADPHVADSRADIYGLGCTLYHLLAGRPPFPGGSIMEKLTAQQKRHPDPIPGLPPGLAVVLAKMTAKRPEDRYQSAEELLAALEPFCEGSPLAPRAVRQASRKVNGQRSSPWATAAVVLITLLAGAAVVLFRIQRDNQEIVITTDDPDVEVVMKRNGELIRIHDTKTGQTWELDAVKNKIGLADQPDGLRLDLPQTEPIILRRKGKRIFTVTRVAAPGKSDRERILGTWQAVAAETDGQEVPREFIDLIQPTLTLTPEKLTARPGMVKVFSFLEAVARRGFLPRETAPLLKKGIEGVYHIDPTKSPKTIDITILGDELRRSALGLYTLDGDTLKLCLSLNPDRVSDRPTEFSSKGSGFRGIVTLKRQVEKGGMIHDLRWPGGKANIYYAAFSPDGRYVLAGTDYWQQQPVTAVWETATGKLVTTLTAPAGAVFLPDSRHLLVSGPDQQLVLWDVIADREVRRFVPRTTQGFLSVSADGSRAVSYNGPVLDGTLTVWDVATGKPIAEWQPKHEGCLARIFPDGQRVVTVGQKDRLVRLWSVAEKKVIREWRSKEESVFGPITFLPDGRSFITSSNTDTRGRVARFDEKSDAPTWLWDDLTQGSMGVSPDGRIALLYNGNTTVRSFDLTTGKELGSVELPSKVHGYMGVSADGRYGVATATSRQTEAPARVYVFRLPALPPATEPSPRPPAPAEPKPTAPDIERLVDPSKAEGNVLPVALVERNGVAAFRFGKWLLVFEGVPCPIRLGIPLLSAFNYPIPGGRGEGQLEFLNGLKSPGPKIYQKWDSKGNELSVNNYRFRLEGKGTRLVFADRSYDASDEVQTIVVARDGTTRLEPPAAKK